MYALPALALDVLLLAPPQHAVDEPRLRVDVHRVAVVEDVSAVGHAERAALAVLVLCGGEQGGLERGVVCGEVVFVRGGLGGDGGELGVEGREDGGGGGGPGWVNVRMRIE
jgi:hypothetical protein